jgi:hypothetical protein
MSELELIMADVERAERTDTPIYDGTAKGISAGWIATDNEGFTLFNGTGEITDDLPIEIQSEIAYVKASPQNFDADETVKDLGTAGQNVRMLDELLTYVRKYGNRGKQDGWDRVAPDVLTADMEYNTDDDYS